MGLYPTVFGDEYTYSRNARLLPFADAGIPGYMYFATYATTNLCGDGFLNCARLLNVAFFVAAAPFIYLIGMSVAGAKTSLLIAVLTLLGPINTYTAYFMPESLYFLAFWLFTFVVLSIKSEHARSRWILAGAVFGICALIKPHALFLVPTLLVYLGLTLYQPAAEKLHGISGSRYLGFFASAAFVKFAIGFALAGVAGMTWFGRSYMTVVQEAGGGSMHYLDLAEQSLAQLRGHLLSLSLLFAMPLGCLLVKSGSVLRVDPQQRVPVNLSLYTLLVLGSLLMVVAAFSASVSGSGPYESDARLHMRYYNFALPLLLLVAASELPRASKTTAPGIRAVVAIPLGLAICYVLFTALRPYVPSFVDSPELRGFTFDPTVFRILGTLSLVSIALWVYSARSGAKCFLYVFMPLAVGFSSFHVNQELRQRLEPDVFDNAGLFTKRYLANDDLSKVVVVGAKPAGLLRALFHLDDAEASYRTIPANVPYDLRRLPDGKEWVLAIGEEAAPRDAYFQLAMPGYTLSRASPPATINFSKRDWAGIISSTQGLSSAEAWGTWSASEVVTFQFAQPLPRKFQLNLIARAFGPNVGAQLDARVGNNAVAFSLAEDMQERRLDFANPDGSSTLSFRVPLPVSPRQLGLSSDERRLGIAFVAMKIVPM